jgi:hypothetical protein
MKVLSVPRHGYISRKLARQEFIYGCTIDHAGKIRYIIGYDESADRLLLETDKQVGYERLPRGC